MSRLIKIEKLRDLILDGITTEELKQYDYSRITCMHGMFQNCHMLETIPLLDTSNVTNMYGMFAGCKSLINIPLLDTSNVEDMAHMFDGCMSLKTVPNLDINNIHLYSVDKIRAGMHRMFDNCDSLENVDMYHFKYRVCKWIIHHKTDEISIFKKCNSPFLKEKYPELYI
jgi:surface protein